MNLANRCPNCGGVADTCIVDVTGRSYYHCMNNLTSFDEEKITEPKGGYTQGLY